MTTDAAQSWNAAHASVLLHVAGRSRLIVSGADRLAFLQGLATNDVEKLPVGASAECAFITPKGKLVADARLVKLEDAVLLDFETACLQGLLEQLEKYRIHDDVDWTDVTDALTPYELWGPRTGEVLGAGAPGANASSAVELGPHNVLAAATPYGACLYVPAGDAAEIEAELVSRLGAVGGATGAGPVVDALRLELGLGRYGVDWDETTNPLEAGLDRAIAFEKGCYVGQEVVAKATFIGQVSRRLVRLSWDGEPAAAGTALVGGRAPGRITSSARVPGGAGVVALGVVKRDAAPAGTKLRVGEGGPEATVLGYPFGSVEKPFQ